mmetsp:Transcript_38498/g.83829  ORF Transcript_38498/g.83829 Transcript_38498/m.83829 type:complete len:205 (-) Transcript_38498:8-622(-)
MEDNDYVTHWPLDSRIDSIVREVASHYSVPVCFVSLHGSKELHFKNSCGLQIKSVASTVQMKKAPLFAIGQHGVQRSMPIIIADISNDERFISDPFVQGEPYARFYVGAPLIYGVNYYMGALCIIDSEPRASVSIDDCDFLTQKAKEIVDIYREHTVPMIDTEREQRQVTDSTVSSLGSSCGKEPQKADAKFSASDNKPPDVLC